MVSVSVKLYLNVVLLWWEFLLNEIKLEKVYFYVFGVFNYIKFRELFLWKWEYVKISNDKLIKYVCIWIFLFLDIIYFNLLKIMFFIVVEKELGRVVFENELRIVRNLFIK